MMDSGSRLDEAHLQGVIVDARPRHLEASLAKKIRVLGKSPHLLVDATPQLLAIFRISRIGHAIVAANENKAVLTRIPLQLAKQRQRVREMVERREQHDTVERLVREGQIG